jgi:competence protein ComEA
MHRPAAIMLISLAQCCLAPAQANAQADAQAPARLVVNINTATRTELIQVPKIGEKMAERIVEFRKANGPFSRIEDIMNVRGMGEKTFLAIRPYLTVGKRPTKEP